MKDLSLPEVSPGLLLSIVEIGGYPNLCPIYHACGYRVETLNSMRKALTWLKRQQPEVVVAEFNFDPMFRDRMSNVESLLATLQRYRYVTRVILLVEPNRMEPLQKVLQRYQVCEVLVFPVDQIQLAKAIGRTS